MKCYDKSVNPINGKEYSIPSIIDDREIIDRFIAKTSKPVVVVQGLGLLGRL